jgi:alkane 1-monooxygenase
MDRRLLDHYRGDIHLAALSPRHQKRLVKRYLPKS